MDSKFSQQQEKSDVIAASGRHAFFKRIHLTDNLVWKASIHTNGVGREILL